MKSPVPPSLVISSVALLFLVNGCADPGQKPNILFIVADDLGYEKLGAYGNPHSPTPVLDQMAEQGILFERAYASPVSTPSRMSFYTGYYAATHQYTSVLPIHHGKTDAIDFDQWPTYAQALRALGYHTAVTGKWQLGAFVKGKSLIIPMRHYFPVSHAQLIIVAMLLNSERRTNLRNE